MAKLCASATIGFGLPVSRRSHSRPCRWMTVDLVDGDGDARLRARAPGRCPGGRRHGAAWWCAGGRGQVTAGHIVAVGRGRAQGLHLESILSRAKRWLVCGEHVVVALDLLRRRARGEEEALVGLKVATRGEAEGASARRAAGVDVVVRAVVLLDALVDQTHGNTLDGDFGCLGSVFRCPPLGQVVETRATWRVVAAIYRRF
ncbi:Hypothetical predicted protein [Cloeon dipterum]|uniref:Uncharacterized protein n=1 Tax=Cloeon dipterum TaxID=197152 RepID=A0A8S1C5S5_9INSE|nr:Hypothetical predicted protein [Cloeon dipterum]